MAKFDYKRPGDEKTLEGGGSGGGYSSKSKMDAGDVGAAGLAASMAALGIAKGNHDNNERAKLGADPRFVDTDYSHEGRSATKKAKGGKVTAYAKGGSIFGRPGDEKTLEGGGSGSGYSSALYKIPSYKTKDTSAETVKALGTGATVAGAGALAALASAKRDTSASDEKSDKESREAANEYKRETRGGNKFAKGGSVSASSRGDGIAQRGKTKGRMC